MPDDSSYAARRVLAVEFGGTHVTCAAIEDGVILKSATLEPDPGALLVKVLHSISSELRQFTDSCGRFEGIGMGFCGLVDHRSGRIASTNGKYDDGSEIDLPAWAEREFGLPFRIENDVRLALLGEHYAGAARGTNDAVLMTVGTGIGTAALVEGHILRGKHSQAGILGGHVKIPGSPNRCSCGGSGCYEAQGSTFSLPAVCGSWPDFEQSALNHGLTLNFANLFRCADQGDAVSQEIRAFCIETWSACAISLVHAYDPERLILGGGVFQNDFPILAAIRDELHRQAWTPWGKVDVVPMQHGRSAALLGVIPLFGERL